MNFKDTSIMFKISGMATILLIFLLVIGWLGLRGVTTVATESDKVTHLLEFEKTLLGRDIDHLQWSASVSAFLLDTSQTSLSVEKDSTQCNLGKWIDNTEEMAALGEVDPNIKRIIDNMKEDHQNLHRSAEQISTTLTDNQGNRALAHDKLIEVYNQSTVPALKNVRQFLHEISSILDQHIAEQGKHLHNVEGGTKRNILLLTIFAIIIGATITLVISRLLTGQIHKTVEFANTLATGNFSTKLDIQQKDEIGVLANALNNIVDSLRNMVGEIKKSSSSVASTADTLSAISAQMSSGAEQTSHRSETVATAAEEMSANMESVAAATEQAATNINMVAAAAEEMTSTISEISANTSKTSSMAEQASSKADQASRQVNELGKSAQEISKVTETITEISEQTNLLALNATIEAARAGEAGKGFAVVANEIKELARQTAAATLEIKNNIEGVQVATKNTVKEINEVSILIKDVNEMSSTVASAIEEQSATTQEISGNIAQASMGILEVTENIAQVATVTSGITADITDVNNSATELNKSSSLVQDRAKELQDLSVTLEKLVNSFKI